MLGNGNVMLTSKCAQGKVQSECEPLRSNEVGQPIFSRSTTKTRVSFAAMPDPGDCAP